IAMATLSRRAPAVFVRRGAERSAIASITSQRRIGNGHSTSQPASTLSGGNQQKVVIARWLLTDADVLLLFDVNRGVDAATKHDTYELVAQLAGQGKAILFH